MLRRAARSPIRLPSLATARGRRLVGAAAIAAALGLVVIVALRPNPFRHTQAIYARFDSVQGLGSIDRNVRAGGVDVGTIGSVERIGDDAIVELEIDPGIEVHADAIAALRPHTLFEGSDYVELEPGSPSAPPLDGNLIPRSQTRVYVSLDQATRVLRTPNRRALRDLIHVGSRVLAGEAIAGLRHAERRAPALMRSLAPAAQALRGPRGSELAGAIRGLAQTTQGLAARERDLVPLVRRAGATARALEARGGAPLRSALGALPGPLRQLRAGGLGLAALADRAGAAARALRPSLRALAPALRQGRPVLRRATPVTRRAVPLVRSLRVVLARVAHVAPVLRRVIAALAPGTRIMARSVLPALGARSRLGLPAYLQLMAAFEGATGAERPFQNRLQNPNGPGHLLRLGAYFDPRSSAGGIALPSCDVIALINPAVAAELQALGLCRS